MPMMHTEELKQANTSFLAKTLQAKRTTFQDGRMIRLREMKNRRIKWVGVDGIISKTILQKIGFYLFYLFYLFQFDAKNTYDTALCDSHGTSRNILELICNEPVEFNLRLDHGLNWDIQEWLTGSDNMNMNDI